MTDVRLTALNPTDSQVYPVACNTSGELLVAGDGTDYLPLTGGDLTGDLTFNVDKITLDATTGSASFAGVVDVNTSVGNNFAITAINNSSPTSFGTIYARNNGTAGAACFQAVNSAGDVVGRINNDGSGSFDGNVVIGDDPWASTAAGVAIDKTGTVSVGNGGGNVWYGKDTSGGISTVTSEIRANGSSTFIGEVQSNNYFWAISDKGNAGIYNYSGTVPGTKSYVQKDGNNAETIVLYYNGNAAYAGTVTATVVPPSDARFKENITPAKPQLADVVALGGILHNYDWNNEAPVNDEIRASRQLGLIAQEAAKICPNLVKELGPEENRYKGIPMEALIMKLIGAVSELKTELDQMKIT